MCRTRLIRTQLIQSNKFLTNLFPIDTMPGLKFEFQQLIRYECSRITEAAFNFRTKQSFVGPYYLSKFLGQKAKRSR